MLSNIQLLQIKNAIKRVLHVPSNYTGGILEMAIVVDYGIPKEEMTENVKQIADALKRQDETFRNVRLNLIKWVSDECIIKEVSSLTVLQMGRGLEDYDTYAEAPGKEEKSVDELFRQLKLFYARSKVILLLEEKQYDTLDENKVKEYLNPFLKRKLIIIEKGNEKRLPIL